MNPYKKAQSDLAKRKERRAKRQEKARVLWADKPGYKNGKSIPTTKLKNMLWDEISLLVRSWSPVCLACRKNPTQVACHIVPSHEGAATRYFLPNLYPGCIPCNGQELWRRASWVKVHETMFGADFVDALYEYAKTKFSVERWWLIEQLERIKKLRGQNAKQTLP